MGRSVSYPRNAEVTFTDLDSDEDCFDFVLEDARESAGSAWPSMEKCDTWLDREDHAIMENGHAYFGVSEYCGLAAYWLVAKQDLANQPLADHWVSSQGPKLRDMFATLAKVGTMSNGEVVFTRVS